MAAAVVDFALMLKRWFNENGWPQKITDDWCKDPGVNYPHGPWASQVCGAMKGAGYSPKSEFFVAFGRFNEYVADADFKSLMNTALKDKLMDSRPLVMDDGEIMTACHFWSVYAGVMPPPERYKSNPEKLTQEDADRFVQDIRDKFREISLSKMIDRSEAWGLVRSALVPRMDPHEISFYQGVLAGIDDPSLEELTACQVRGVMMDELDNVLRS